MDLPWITKPKSLWSKLCGKQEKRYSAFQLSHYTITPPQSLNPERSQASSCLKPAQPTQPIQPKHPMQLARLVSFGSEMSSTPLVEPCGSVWALIDRLPAASLSFMALIWAKATSRTSTAGIDSGGSIGITFFIIIVINWWKQKDQHIRLLVHEL